MASGKSSTSLRSEDSGSCLWNVLRPECIRTQPPRPRVFWTTPLAPPDSSDPPRYAPAPRPPCDSSGLRPGPRSDALACALPSCLCTSSPAATIPAQTSTRRPARPALVALEKTAALSGSLSPSSTSSHGACLHRTCRVSHRLICVSSPFPAGVELPRGTTFQNRVLRIL